MGTKLMLTNVRCSFLVLGEPEQYQGKGPFRWSASALVPYDSPLKKQVDAALEACALEKWEKKAKTVLEAVLPDPKGCCWMDGNTPLSHWMIFPIASRWKSRFASSRFTTL